MFLLNDLVSFKSSPGIYRISKIGNDIKVINKIYNSPTNETMSIKKVYYLHDLMSRSKRVLYSAFDNEIVLVKSFKPFKTKIFKKKTSIQEDAQLFLNFFKCIN